MTVVVPLRLMSSIPGNIYNLQNKLIYYLQSRLACFYSSVRLLVRFYAGQPVFSRARAIGRPWLVVVFLLDWLMAYGQATPDPSGGKLGIVRLTAFAIRLEFMPEIHFMRIHLLEPHERCETRVPSSLDKSGTNLGQYLVHLIS